MRTTSEASPDDLLTTKEVADRCRVSTVTVTRWLNEGHLVGVKVGPRTFRFRRVDVDALLDPTPPVEPVSEATA